MAPTKMSLTSQKFSPAYLDTTFSMQAYNTVIPLVCPMNTWEAKWGFGVGSENKSLTILLYRNVNTPMLF